MVELVEEAKGLVSDVRNEYTIKETIQNANALYRSGESIRPIWGR